MSVASRLRGAWNAFLDNGEKKNIEDIGYGNTLPQHKTMSWKRYTRGSILNTILNRISMDVASVAFDHVKMDDDPQTEEQQDSGLHLCLTLEANIDQNSSEFLQDLAFSMLDEGVVAVVPVETSKSPNDYEGFDIKSLRVGKITQWYPQAVTVNLYNERTGQYEEVTVSKEFTAIITNPLYEVINSSNSTLSRLKRKLEIMDTIDEGNASARLDLILQLPYPIKSDIKRREAEDRVSKIEEQLQKSAYGIAYIDGTEHITQLNRSIENNMLKEVEYLTEELFNQLGLTKAVFNGTASETELKSYYDRTINPICKRISLELSRKFLSKNARTQGHTVVYHTDMFTLVPMEHLASAIDTLRRNTIITTNEGRKIIGLQPSDDPRANELFNPNISDKNQFQGPDSEMGQVPENPDSTIDTENIMKGQVNG